MKEKIQDLELSFFDNNIYIRNIQPNLNHREVIDLAEKEIAIGHSSGSMSFQMFAEEGKYPDPLEVSLDLTKPNEAIIMARKHGRSINHTIDDMKNLGYEPATVMDALYIWTLTNNNFSVNQKKEKIFISNLVKYLLMPGTRTNHKEEATTWSLIPRFAIKPKLILDSIIWRNMQHTDDSGVVGIKNLNPITI